MMTSLKPSVDLTKDALAYTVDQNITTPQVGQKVKLYIPVIMANIPQEAKSKDYKLITKGNTIFKNAPACRPSVQTTLTAQNYIEAECENNTNWDGADSISLDSKGAVKKRTVNSQTKLTATFTNGKFKSITFNTCKYTSDSITKTQYTSTGRYSGDVKLSDVKETVSDIDTITVTLPSVESYTSGVQTMGVMPRAGASEIEIPDVDSINATINALSRDVQEIQKTLNTLLQRLESTKTISVDQSKRW